MDLNAYLDNEYYVSSLYFLRADIYINDKLILENMTDFTAGNWYDDPNLGTVEWVLENGFPCGTTYRFVIKGADGYKCVKNCDVKGTVSGGSDGSWGVKIIPYIETIK